jgi:hypothetical protein
VPRGWAKYGPVKTQARIDVPKGRGTVQSGRVPIAGVAWSPGRGIAKVELSIDAGPWLEAALADDVATSSWRQWRHVWDAPIGRHTIAVRATDRSGEIQTAAKAPPRPDGASGHHQVTVRVV